LLQSNNGVDGHRAPDDYQHVAASGRTRHRWPRAVGLTANMT